MKTPLVEVHTVVYLHEGEHVVALGLTPAEAAQLRALLTHDGAGMAPKRLSDALKKRLMKTLEGIEPTAPPPARGDAEEPMRVGTAHMGKRRPT